MYSVSAAGIAFMGTVNAKQGIKVGASCVALSPLQSFSYWPKCCLRATEPVQHTNLFAPLPLQCRLRTFAHDLCLISGPNLEFITLLHPLWVCVAQRHTAAPGPCHAAWQAWTPTPHTSP